MSEVAQQSKFRREKVVYDPFEEGWGWGYLIGVGMALPIACALGSLNSFALMFNDFITNCGGGTSAVTIINGSYFSAISFAGLFSSSLFKKFSMRSVGIFGAAIYFLGSLMTVFVTSVTQLIIAFGVMQGAGFGFCIPVAFTLFNQYFVKRRVFVMSLAQTLIGVVTMIYPILVHFLMNKYGFRGAMAVIAALNAHVIFGMVIMHPLKWHCKVIRIPIDETKSLMDGDEGEKESKVATMSDDEFELNQLPSYVKPRLSVPHEDQVLKNFRNENGNFDVLIKCERSKSLDPTQIEGFDPIKKRISSMMSLGEWGGAAYLNENSESGAWQKVVNFLDLTLLKDLVYLNIVLGISFALYSDNSFFTLQPMYLFELGFSKADTAVIVATGAAADMSSRMFLALMCFWFQIKARTVYLAGVIGSIIARFVFLLINDFVGMAIITAIMGFLRTWLHVPLALVFGEYLPQNRFSSGYGLFMFLQGNFAFLIGPFIGWIRDVTQDYIICFHSLTFILALCAVPWIVEIVLLRFNSRTQAHA